MTSELRDLTLHQSWATLIADGRMVVPVVAAIALRRVLEVHHADG